MSPTASTVEHLREQGYAIVPGVLDRPTLARARRSLKPHLGRYQGRNPFEGHRTERVYTLVGRGRVFEEIAVHPTVLGICDALLMPGYLLSASQAIDIHPGEVPQAFHTDDSFYPIARPRPAYSIAVIFAVDDFTEENGATNLIPGSHLWSDAEIEGRTYGATAGDRPPGAADLAKAMIPATMPAGSGLFLLGTLVHRGGANQSGGSRLGLTNQYCEPWARPQENYFLAVPRARAARMPQRLQDLLGYSVLPPFMGHAGGLHPRRKLVSRGKDLS